MKEFCLILLLKVPLSLAAPRSGVVVRGTTVQPGFTIKGVSGPSTECPADHPYIVNNKTHCCSSSQKKNDSTIDSTCDGSFLSQTDPLDCCLNDDHVTCSNPPCKTHWRGLLKTVTRYIYQGKSTGFHDYSLDTSKSPDYPVSGMTSPTHGLYYHAAWLPYKHGAIMCGGYAIASDTSPTQSQECSFYDPIKDSWDASFPDFQEGHYRGCILMVGNVMFAFGGSSPAAHTLKTEFFNEAANAWQYSPSDDMPVDPYSAAGSRYMVGVAFSDDEVYFFGGYQAGGVYISDVVYHKIGGIWNKRNNMASPKSNPGIGVIDFRGKRQIILAGGRSGPVHQEVEIYDPDTNSWTRDANLQLPSPARFYYQYMSQMIDGKLHLFGGRDNDYILDVLVFEGEDASPVWRKLRPLQTGCDNGVVITTQEPRAWLVNNGP